jgi:hypothetical protein
MSRRPVSPASGDTLAELAVAVAAAIATSATGIKRRLTHMPDILAYAGNV